MAGAVGSAAALPAIGGADGGAESSNANDFGKAMDSFIMQLAQESMDQMNEAISDTEEEADEG